MVKKILMLMVVLATIPFLCMVIASEVISDHEMAEISGESGIVVENPNTRLMEAIREARCFEDFENLSDLEQAQIMKIIREKIGELPIKEQAQIKEYMRQRLQDKKQLSSPSETALIHPWRHEEMAAMSPEERDQMRLQIRERISTMTAEDRAQITQMRQLMKQHMGGCPFERQQPVH